MDTTELLSQNSFIEVQDWLVNDLDRPVDDSDFDPEAWDKITLANRVEAATVYAKTYLGTSNFMNELRGKVLRGIKLSPKQCRAALNVMQQDLTKGRIKILKADGMSKPIPTVKSVVVSDAEHDKKVVVTEEVIESHEESILDIGAIPDGRYAVPSGSDSTKQTVFFRIATRKKGTMRTRRFRYSKFTHGKEWIPAGTVEVQEVVSNRKRIFGEQLPGEGYKGEYIDELSHVLANPELYATLYSMHKGTCSICGRDLTDTISQELNIGPECEKKYGRDYWDTFKRVIPVAPSAATP